MKDTFDHKLREMAEKEKDTVPKLPPEFDVHMEKILQKLPERRRKRLTWKGALVPEDAGAHPNLSKNLKSWGSAADRQVKGQNGI